jgi:hypothetical protein
MTKIKVESITVNRIEGKSVSAIPRELTVDNWRMAELFIGAHAATSPRKGEGYDKTDFTIVYADGFEYSGRIDLNFHMIRKEDNLEKHVKANLEYIQSERYLEMMKGFRKEDEYDEVAEQAREILSKYEIGA